MKNILKSTLFLIFIALMTLSCQDQNEELSQQDELLSITDIEKLATQHNDALEQTLIGLKNSKVSTIESPDDMELLLNKESGSYYQSNYGGNNLLEADNHSQREVSKFFSRANTNSRLNSMSPIEIVIEEAKDQLSSKQIDLPREVV